MKASSIRRAQAALWRQLGEAVEILAAPDFDSPVAVTAIRMIDDSEGVAGDGETIVFEEAIRGFAFRLSDALTIKEGYRIRYEDRLFECDGLESVAAETERWRVHEREIESVDWDAMDFLQLDWA